MSDYKRWISYVYIYEENVKKNNVGYIRVEQKDSKVRISVHIKVMSITDPMKVYLYVRRDGIMKGTYIGDITMDKNATQQVYHLDTEIASDVVDISDTGGVIVYHSDEKFFASEWDDVKISIKDFVINDNGSVENETVENETAENETAENETVDNDGEDNRNDVQVDLIATSMDHQEDESMFGEDIDALLDVGSENVYGERTGETSENVCGERNGETSENVCGERTGAHDESPRDMSGNVDDNSENDRVNSISATKEKLSEKEIKRNDIVKTAEKMLVTYPKMFPFDNDEKIMCVRIEPQDIGRLPIDTWVLVNNSFLLQGYYSYRHLILMRTGDDMRPSYLIGVPGIYRGRDEYMAQMFGFGLFKPMKKCENLRGEFGYWCISLTDIPESRKYW